MVKRGPKPKPDQESTRRGVMVQLERVLLARIDTVRGETRRTTWIRQAIEEKLGGGEAPDSDWLKRIDDWRRKQVDLPSRVEAIRRLVDQAIEADQDDQIS